VVDSLILLSSTDAPLYGIAEFRGGASEPGEDFATISTPPTASASVPTSTSKSPVPIPEYNNSAEVWHLLRKGVFFAIILGCIVVYLRISKKKDKRYHKKGMM